MHQVTEIPKLSARESYAHKGDFGRVCIVAGSLGMSGAAAIAGRAALRAGAGLVKVAVPESVLEIVAAIEPCFTTMPLPQDSRGRISAKAIAAVSTEAEVSDVMAFGPGVGTSRGTRAVLDTLIGRAGLRLVIDADGVNCLAKSVGWTEKAKASILTGKKWRLFPQCREH